MRVISGRIWRSTEATSVTEVSRVLISSVWPVSCLSSKSM